MTKQGTGLKQAFRLVLYKPLFLASRFFLLASRAFSKLYMAAFYTYQMNYCFKPREDDIYVVSYPRSGTTWLQMLLYQMTSDGALDFTHISERVPFFERAIASGIGFDDRASPRVFKTHLDFGALGSMPGRFIYISRKGDEVLDSYFRFYVSHLRYQGTFDQFFELFMQGKLQCGSWFEHVKNWKSAAGRANVALVSYEEMSSDLDATVMRLGKFLGLSMDAAKLDSIRERCSLQFMKDNEGKFDHLTELALEYGWITGSFIRDRAERDAQPRMTEAQHVALQNAIDKQGLNEPAHVIDDATAHAAALKR